MDYVMMVILHAVENILLTVPAFYTYSNIKKRNIFLEDSVGLLPLAAIIFRC